jgi:polyisoprenoid-binding protein YceI
MHASGETRMARKWHSSLAVLTLAVAAPALAAEVAYDIDPEHTYPSFEADHFGISTWRGKFNRSTGKLTLDKSTGTGTVDVIVDLASIDFGHDKLNEWATGPEFFDVAKYPRAHFEGKLTGFKDGGKPHVTGRLTLHGLTRPIELDVDGFKCIEHPLSKRDYCGADALATFNRDEFGLGAGKDYGFSMKVTLRIQVEATAAP